MNNPPVIHVVTPESSSGKLWAEIQRLQAVEAESARTIAHLNHAHREVSDMQKARIDELEKALSSFLARYVRLVESGDCGFWNPEDEDEVKLARAVLAKTEPKP